MAGTKGKKAARQVKDDEFAQDQAKISDAPKGQYVVTDIQRNGDGSIYFTYEIGGRPTEGLFGRWDPKYREEGKPPYTNFRTHSEKVLEALATKADEIGAKALAADARKCMTAGRVDVSDW